MLLQKVVFVYVKLEHKRLLCRNRMSETNVLSYILSPLYSCCGSFQTEWYSYNSTDLHNTVERSTLRVNLLDSDMVLTP